MNTLQENLDEIKRQKDEFIIPENIKKDVTVLGVTGTLDAGGSEDLNEELDTQDNVLENLEQAINSKSSDAPILPLNLPDTFTYDNFLDNPNIWVDIPEEVDSRKINLYTNVYGKYAEDADYELSAGINMQSRILFNDEAPDTMALEINYMDTNTAKMTIYATAPGYKPYKHDIYLDKIAHTTSKFVILITDDNWQSQWGAFNADNIELINPDGQVIEKYTRTENIWTDTISAEVTSGWWTIRVKYNDEILREEGRWINPGVSEEVVFNITKPSEEEV